MFVVGWTGMRGFIALAAAISLPQSLVTGNPFSQRSLIIVLTFSVILVTLVLQGLTLPTIIRAVGLGGAGDVERSTREARLASLQSEQAEADGQQVRWQARYLDASRQLLDFERETALRLRREGRISSEALAEIQRDLDLSVVRVDTQRRSELP
jgi:NhaP-type Na+/H+ and K+/H+ antiporter